MLLAKATLRESCEIQFKQGTEERTVQATIQDVFTKEKVEYLQLSTGQTIRLDDLTRVNGLALPK